jgi:THO complex subunit 4
MSAKLDKSLDEILVNRRQNARRRTRRPAASKPGSAAVPVGGVKKNAKAAKPVAKGAQGGHPIATESKIMVSGLVSLHLHSELVMCRYANSFKPSDVNEANIKVC